MLILTRRPGESTMIGDNIEVRIVSVNGDRVRIAIEAPRDVNIVRKELVQQSEGECHAG